MEHLLELISELKHLDIYALVFVTFCAIFIKVVELYIFKFKIQEEDTIKFRHELLDNSIFLRKKLDQKEAELQECRDNYLDMYASIVRYNYLVSLKRFREAENLYAEILKKY